MGIMVAHPDDETLWAGGAILLHPQWRCSVYTLCRASDPDRAPRFYRALERLGASGRMADLDDSPQQTPLAKAQVEQTVVEVVGGARFDLLITHSPLGEYTRNRRHEEVAKAVTALWQQGRILADALWLFAYDGSNRLRRPGAIADADVTVTLSPAIWHEKCRIIHDIYGFAADSWEAQIVPRVEAFWRFQSPEDLGRWPLMHRVRSESRHPITASGLRRGHRQ